MRVAIIGLGDIARKAYLPTLAVRPGVEPVLMTRSQDRLAETAAAYRVPDRDCHTDLSALLRRPPEAAFVHAATEAHAELLEALIDAGVPTYVDKPLAPELEAAERIVARAERAGVGLMVGFNRRYAPGYAAARERPRDLVFMQKNQQDRPDAPRRVVFDDFIHVVDTLRFLAPGGAEALEAAEVSVDARVRGGALEHVVLRLAGRGWTAIGAMNRVSGAKEERLEVSGDGGKFIVDGLADTVEHAGALRTERRGDWTPVARQRGIEQICTAFLEAVAEGAPLDARDALRTHELCERIVTQAEGRRPGGA
ncbi:Gfo/Idh/MocA family protein [Nocardiopsis chromatogenes]|uniref:Gfo/Idh/MocA family protein n=1 Tax=Nocardiopsis chromatogenes TaxID=280239 RepID=UPI00034D1506|nr:Gfo/Idh/MocA family oxidoreductase [Nocardiopsis chromatogenes]